VNITKTEFPSTVRVGASVLLGEDCSLENVEKLVTAGGDFIELNTKYLSRRYPDDDYLAKDKASQSFEDFWKQATAILDVCSCPIWIKFSRDILWLRTKEVVRFAQGIRRNDVAFVFANTRQVNVIDHWLTPDGKAVIWGKSLFTETFDLVKQIRRCIPEHIPIVANGGVTTYRQFRALLDAGASAVECCAYFHDGERDLAEWKLKLASR